MVRYYAARELAHNLRIPINRWKRWAREFLPPDPLGGLQSGYARQYSLENAFTVYLGGYLVSRMGFSIPESRRIMKDLEGFLRKGLRNGSGAGMDEHQTAAGCPSERVEIDIGAAHRSNGPQSVPFAYRVRVYQPRCGIPQDRPSHWQEQYEEQLVGVPALHAKAAYPPLGKVLHVTEICTWFMALLGL